MKTLNQKGLDIIKRWEQGPHGGYAAFPYMDDNDGYTVGYGHLIKDGDSFSYPLNERKALAILRDDISWAESQVNKLITAPVSDNQFSAMVSLVFNIGSGAFGGSTMRRLFNTGDRVGAAREFGKWVNDDGQPMSGLIKRRAQEVLLFLA